MDFILQLKMLLWKNYTLKKRRPFVVAFETLIPLVLFMVLMGIRLRRQPLAVDENIFAVKALPSAGIIPLLQMFCPNKTQNKHGFPIFPESKTDELLMNLTIILKNVDKNHGKLSLALNRDYDYDYGKILDEVSGNNTFSERNIPDFELRDILKDPDGFSNFLTNNLSIPVNMSQALLNSTVNGSKVMEMLKASMLKYESPASYEEKLNNLPKILLLRAALDRNFLKNPKDVGEVVANTLYTNNNQNTTAMLMDNFYNRDKLQEISCSAKTFNSLVQTKQTPEQQEQLRKRLCNLTNEQFANFSQEIQRQINMDAVNKKFVEGLTQGNGTKSFEEKYEGPIASLNKNIELLKENQEVLKAAVAIAKLLKINESSNPNFVESDLRENANVHLAKKIWKVIGPVLCGPDMNEYEKDPCPDAMYDHPSNSRALVLMLYVMTNNPLIVYSPRTPDVDAVVTRANWTFQAVADSISAGHWWLKYSKMVRTTINSQNFTSQLDSMKRFFDVWNENQVKDNLKQPGLFDFDRSIIQGFDVDKTTKRLKFADHVVKAWLSKVENISLDVFLGFNTSKDLDDFMTNRSSMPKYKDRKVVAGIVFTNINKNGTLPPHVEYKIRMNSTFTQDTTIIRSNYWQPGPECEYQPYYFFGFDWFQDLFDRAIIDEQVNAGSNLAPASYLQEIPYPCYMSDSFMFVIKHMVPLCMVISWIYTVSITVQSIVYEKERRLKEFMKMMGLSNIVHWIAWFITSLCTISITVGLLTLILKYGKILTYSNPFLVWIFLMQFAIATIVFCFLISVFFSKAKLAAACGGIIYFLTYMPFVFISIREDAAKVRLSGLTKSFASLFSTTAFGLASRYFALYEEQSIGVQWSNIGKSPLENDDFNIQKVFYMLIVDTLLYAVLVWYIEAVHPGSYGLPRPWYFPLQASYWFGHNTKACAKFPRSYLVLNDEDHGAPGSLACEKDPVNLPLGVVIEGLVKIYKSGSKRAVNRLSLNLYEGQITSFLGHNGAGKTTTMSLLTGLFPPTQGTAYIYENDIRYDMDDIRKSLGFCPQHNVLFDKLTVEEHLGFYARLKGMSSHLVDGEVDRLLIDLGLPGKRHSLVDTLSGGMKRKLSIAVAFVGKSRMVILDEPTAGVDPYARRAIWDLLIKYKQGRTILLSTHFMDEADVLGDRIAIISDGKLQCLGSSLFLKSHFGDGYHLTLVKKSCGSTQNSFSNTPRGSLSNVGIIPPTNTPQAGTPPMIIPGSAPSSSSAPGTPPFSDSLLSSSLGSSPNMSALSPLMKLARQSPRGSNLSISEPSTETVTSFVQSYISSAKLTQESRQQLSFILPNNVVKKDGFGNFFAHLEQNLEALGLKSFGITETPLEEVFLKVTDIAAQEETDSLADSQREDGEDETANDETANDETANDELPEHHVTNGAAVNTEVPGVEMMDIAGHDEGNDDDPLLELNQRDRVFVKRSQPIPTPRNTRTIITQHNANGIQGNHVSNGHRYAEGSNNEASGAGSYVLSGASLKWQQFCGLLVKRFYQTRRNLKGLFSQIFLPSFFITVAMVFALSIPKPKDAPPLSLNTGMFDRPNYVPFGNENASDRLSVGMETTLKLPSGIGSFCYLKNPSDRAWTWSYSSNPCKSRTSANREVVNSVLNQQCVEKVYSDVRLCKNDTMLPDPVKHKTKARKNTTHCYCSDNRLKYTCPVSFPAPKEIIPATFDTLRNVTGRDVIKYLLYTTDKTVMARYGGMVFGENVPSIPAAFSNFSCVNINCDTVKRLGVWKAVKALYNNKGYHSQPVFLNAMDNAILRHYLPASKGNPGAYGISVTNHPFNKSGERLSWEYRRSGTNVVIAIFVIVAMSFVPAGFVVFLVTERSTSSKHLQFVCGLDPFIYWLSNYLWDMCNYLIPAAVCITILYSFQVPAYASPTNFPAVVALFILYGWSVTPLMYPASFFFKVPSTAYVFMIVANLFVGITTTVSTSILEIFVDDDVLGKINEVLGIVSLVFPNYCLGRGLMNLAYNEYKNDFKRRVGQSYDIQSPFEMSIVTKNLLCMAGEGFFYFGITLLIQYYKFFKKSKNLPQPSSELEDDEDVAEERERVLSGDADDDLVCLKNLTKVYFSNKTGDHLAVDRLCLGIQQGECFGLLGVNGAGKTSTFKMLTGDTSITSGEAFLNSHSVCKEILEVHRCIGYCPQFDALIDEMTAREHLTLYARLRGVPAKERKQVVDWAITKLSLTKFADKPSKTYSGGMKRKLSTAIALIGDPPIIFLDEPTTGMDPKARRFLWDTVISIVKEGRSVVLTSHSMEECEALCTRMAIMVNGQFKCLGSTQHLKNRFGNGYIVTLRIKGENPNLNTAINFFSQNMPNSSLKEKHHNMLQYHLPSGAVKLSSVFELIENHLEDLEIEDFSVSQTTLDNVFINFARQQTDEVEFKDARYCDWSRLFTSRRPGSRRFDTVRFSALPEEEQDLNDDNYQVTFSDNSHLAFSPEVSA